MTKDFFKPEPHVFAHRGLPLDYPENTMISFENAVKLGVDVIETDAHLTKDNQFVICHDSEISRISNGNGLIKDYTLKQLKEFDAAYNFSKDGGHTFPFRDRGITFVSVAEILEKFPKQRFNIDLKDKNQKQVELWAELIKEYDAEHRILTASQFTENLKEVRLKFPNMATSFSAGEVFRFYLKNKFRGLKSLKKADFKGDALQVPEKMFGMRIVSEKSIKRAHQLGFKIHVWTINNEKDMIRLLKLGVDGIFTDNAPLLKSILKKYKK